jgi:hypothetical protein
LKCVWNISKKIREKPFYEIFNKLLQELEFLSTQGKISFIVLLPWFSKNVIASIGKERVSSNIFSKATKVLFNYRFFLHYSGIFSYLLHNFCKTIILKFHRKNAFFSKNYISWFIEIKTMTSWSKRTTGALLLLPIIKQKSIFENFDQILKTMPWSSSVFTVLILHSYYKHCGTSPLY